MAFDHDYDRTLYSPDWCPAFLRGPDYALPDTVVWYPPGWQEEQARLRAIEADRKAGVEARVKAETAIYWAVREHEEQMKRDAEDVRRREIVAAYVERWPGVDPLDVIDLTESAHYRATAVHYRSRRTGPLCDWIPFGGGIALDPIHQVVVRTRGGRICRTCKAAAKRLKLDLDPWVPEPPRDAVCALPASRAR